jgi:Domain of unknown function (DUF4129)
MSWAPAADICDSAHVHADDDAGARPGAARRPGPLTWVLAGLVAVLVTALAVLGARSRPWVPQSAPSAPTLAGPPALPQSRLPAAVTQSAPPTPFTAGNDGGILAYVLVAIVLVLLVAGLALLASGLLHRPGWRRRPPVPEGDPLEPADRSATALPGAVERALDAVEDPDAREAVVQAWLLLGRAAAASGTAPRPAETAAEYARRLAAERGLPAGAVEALAALYREARFSTHEVRPEQRDAARAHLLDLRAALAASPVARGSR